MGNYLHGGVVHNHILKGDLGVVGCHLLAALEEETIAQFPVGDTGQQLGHCNGQLEGRGVQMTMEGWVLTSSQSPFCKMGRILLHLPQVGTGVRA